MLALVLWAVLVRRLPLSTKGNFSLRNSPIQEMSGM